MNAEALAPPVVGRIGHIYQMEVGLAQALDRLSGGAGSAAAQVARMGSLAGQHLRALTEIVEARAIDLSPTATERDDIARSEVAPVLQQAVDAAAALATAYASLYATGRLPFEGDICDLADRHAAEWVAEFHTAHDLVPVAVIEELVSQRARSRRTRQPPGRRGCHTRSAARSGRHPSPARRTAYPGVRCRRDPAAHGGAAG